MRVLLGVLLGCWASGWPAVAADKNSVDPQVENAAVAPAVAAPATSPAGDEVRPTVGPQKRFIDAQRRRNNAQGGQQSPRRQDRPRPDPAPEEPPLAESEVGTLMQFARDNFPEVAERLQRLREMDPQSFRRMTVKLRNRLKPIFEMQGKDPQAAKRMIEEQRIQLAIMDLADQYRKAKSDGERARLKEEIEGRIRERFDRRQGQIRSEIERLQKRLDEQARQLADREQNRDELLRKEFERIAGKP